MDVEVLTIKLLAGRDPDRAREFFLAWGERRAASWANAASDARGRAASDGHLKQLRGQLRYHLGEAALNDSAHQANVGAIPMATMKPGGTFTVARLGRFALVSVMVRDPRGMVRPTLTRKHLSKPNEELDPQFALFEEERSARGATELAYLGCLVAVPSRRDPTVPADLVMAVPNAGMRDWLV